MGLFIGGRRAWSGDESGEDWGSAAAPPLKPNSPLEPESQKEFQRRLDVFMQEHQGHPRKPKEINMSSEVGSVQGKHHVIKVWRSDGGVELAITQTATTGFGDTMSPDTARGLAALLCASADIVEKHIADRLKGT